MEKATAKKEMQEKEHKEETAEKTEHGTLSGETQPLPIKGKNVAASAVEKKTKKEGGGGHREIHEEKTKLNHQDTTKISQTNRTQTRKNQQVEENRKEGAWGRILPRGKTKSA